MALVQLGFDSYLEVAEADYPDLTLLYLLEYLEQPPLGVQKVFNLNAFLHESCLVLKQDEEVCEQHNQVLADELLVLADEHGGENAVQPFVFLHGLTDQHALFEIQAKLVQDVLRIDILGFLFLVHVFEEVIVHMREHALNFVVLKVFAARDAAFEPLKVKHVLVLDFVTDVVQIKYAFH